MSMENEAGVFKIYCCGIGIRRNGSRLALLRHQLSKPGGRDFCRDYSRHSAGVNPETD